MSEPYRVRRQQWLPTPVEQIFEFFADARNLAEITPPWLGFKILTPAPILMAQGTVIEYKLSLHGVPVRWKTLIAEWQPPRFFIDVQLRGPYRMWRHTHTFQPERGGTLMSDEVEYRMPLGPLGRIAHRLTVRRDIDAIFDYRAKVIAERNY